MATMEHFCRACGHVEFNNRPHLASCPKCGRGDILSTRDEEPDPPERDEDDCDDDEEG